MTIDELKQRYEAARDKERRLYSTYMASGMNTHREAWETWQGQKAHADRLQRAIERYEGKPTPQDKLETGVDRAIEILGRNAVMCERLNLYDVASAYRHAARLMRRVKAGQTPEDLYDDLRTSAEVFRAH